MNEETKLASGSVLLFLHADTYLPPDAIKMIMAVMADRQVVGGAFTMNFDKGHPLLKAMSRFTRINHMLFTFGDPGFFVYTDTE